MGVVRLWILTDAMVQRCGRDSGLVVNMRCGLAAGLGHARTLLSPNRMESKVRSFQSPAWLLVGVLAIAPSLALSQTVVPGPWGDIVDHQKPLVVETDRERMILLRRNQMRAISGHFRSIEAVVTYRAPYADTLAADAAALVAAARMLPGLFPPGTEMDAGAFGARPEIWQNLEKFAQHGTSFTRSVEQLAAAVAAKADLDGPLTAVRHECLACHQAYRVFAPTNRPPQPAAK